jgi:hypothetical protein
MHTNCKKNSLRKILGELVFVLLPPGRPKAEFSKTVDLLRVSFSDGPGIEAMEYFLNGSEGSKLANAVLALLKLFSLSVDIISGP